MTCYSTGTAVENDLRRALCKLHDQGIVRYFEDHTQKTDMPDFWVQFSRDKIDVSDLSERDRALILKTSEYGVWLEAKVRGKYSMENWPLFAKLGINDCDAFIEDDLTIRRLEWYGHGLSKYIVVGVNDGRICVYPAAVLNRLRHIALANREISGFSVPKGKWLLSLKWASQCTSMEQVILRTLGSCRKSAIWAGVLESISAPINIEGINAVQGIPRTHEHRKIDLEVR